jgi:AAA ATPase-like protein
VNASACRRYPSDLEDLGNQAVKNAEAEGSLIKAHLKTSSYTSVVGVYEEYNESTVKDSGNWLFQESAYTSWLNQSQNAKPLLFVTGPPGTGKSFLSTFTISRIKERYMSTAYFYVKASDSASQDLCTLLKTLAYQLALNDFEFRKHSVDVLGKEDALISPKAIWNSLFLAHFGPLSNNPGRQTVIVIDGLDEAPSNTVKTIVDLFRGLLNCSGTNKLFIALFGRPEIGQYIYDGLEKFAETIDITRKNVDDIRLYSTQEVKKMSLIRQKRAQESTKSAAEAARQIRDTVVDNADGMFFKAVLIFKQIMEKPRLFSILNAIKSSPPGLDDMICKVFERVLEDPAIELEDLRELLIWASFAKRPPRLTELYTFFEHRDGQPYELLENHLRGKLASLFILQGPAVPEPELTKLAAEGSRIGDVTDDFDIDEFQTEDIGPEPALSSHSNQANKLHKNVLQRYSETTVQFSHASVRDFVTAPAEKRMADRLGISIYEAESQWHLTIACLNCILDFNISRDWTRCTYWSHCRLIEYAVGHWSDHLLSVKLEELSEVQRTHLALKICQVFGGGAGSLSFVDASYVDYNKTLHVIITTSTVFDYMRQLLDSTREKNQCLDLTHEQEHWLQNGSKSREKFFQKIIQAAHRRLMTRTDHKDWAYENDQYFIYHAWIVHSLTMVWVLVVLSAHNG